MRVVAFTEFGASPAIHEIDVPAPGAGEVRVRVHAASINGFDLAVANGYVQGMMEHRFPVVLGKDFAGVVDAVGEGADGYAVGDRVFGTVTKPYLGDGSLGEYVTVPVAIGVAKLPEAVSFTDGGALGLAGSAAVDAVTAAAPQPGERVLVSGATGGVGNLVVQLATRAGATVIATAHTDEEKALVTSLGAAETADHTTDLAAQVKDVDVVFHLAGDPAALLGVLRSGGRFVSTLVGSPDQLPTEEHTVLPVFAQPTEDKLNRLASGETRVVVEKVYPFEEATAAIAHFVAGTKGKIVVSLI
ncbi:NADPH:quinone reductase-like Zn-dependent oxidoreductase [Catenuloplanes nepalensis]|uniref:NADPH:quinone reductase-like Zn-dependent oxidoreductase n=1 Tax=Catenuloplanes nepalensis TaxID=587533 RepID=A0ABT9MNF9_9ACTN|nr:NADP-dependent oxidoreductase [Catenuloplanes nepalensis]MDP9792997.1 NADPH:quinone reductase-like Zn-dependent oxidoreductase [Catenuloplanes nepalensis]